MYQALRGPLLNSGAFSVGNGGHMQHQINPSHLSYDVLHVNYFLLLHFVSTSNKYNSFTGGSLVLCLAVRIPKDTGGEQEAEGSNVHAMAAHHKVCMHGPKWHIEWGFILFPKIIS
eukprot:1157667-Pelagomonas_calceolata.AAC.4